MQQQQVQEEIAKISLIPDLNQVWVETNGVLRQNKTSVPKLYKLLASTPIAFNPDVIAKHQNSSPLYDAVSEFLVNA